MSREEDGFLSRWSRRKQEARRAPEPDPAPLPDPPPELQEPASEAQVPAPDPDAITPEELAALPPVESIGPDTDIAGFLRKGVPAALRKAALRRVWAADPAIRDYVNEAREYAYDWNVPGGVPGSGELAPGEAESLLARMFGGPADEPRPGVTHEGPPGTREVAGDPTPETAPAAEDEPVRQAHDTEERSASPAPQDPAAQAENAPKPAQNEPVPPRPRRHGGAMPV